MKMIKVFKEEMNKNLKEFQEKVNRGRKQIKLFKV